MGLQLGSGQNIPVYQPDGVGAPVVGVALKIFGKTNEGGAHTFFRIHLGGSTIPVPLLRTFFGNPHFLPIFKENCGNDIVSAVCYWGMETFFEDQNGGAMILGLKSGYRGGGLLFPRR